MKEIPKIKNLARKEVLVQAAVAAPPPPLQANQTGQNSLQTLIDLKTK